MGVLVRLNYIMLKRIKVSQLQVGMYVHDLDCGWLEHPFFRSRFMIIDNTMIEKIKVVKIQHLVDRKSVV